MGTIFASGSDLYRDVLRLVGNSLRGIPLAALRIITVNTLRLHNNLAMSPTVFAILYNLLYDTNCEKCKEYGACRK